MLYGDYRYGWTEKTVGLMLAAVGVATMIVQGGLVGRIVSALGEPRALAAGFICGAIGMAIFGLAPTGALFMAGIPFTALYGLASPSLRSLMTQHAGPNEQGQLQGATASINGIASLIAPLLFTQTFAAAVRSSGPLHVPGAPFLLAAFLLVAALVVGARAVRASP